MRKSWSDSAARGANTAIFGVPGDVQSSQSFRRARSICGGGASWGDGRVRGDENTLGGGRVEVQATAEPEFHRARVQPQQNGGAWRVFS
jgi:hypothetical protein